MYVYVYKVSKLRRLLLNSLCETDPFRSLPPAHPLCNLKCPKNAPRWLTCCCFAHTHTHKHTVTFKLSDQTAMPGQKQPRPAVKVCAHEQCGFP